MSKEILLVVDAVSNEKGVSKDVIFEALEAALASAARRFNEQERDVIVVIDRETGDYETFRRWEIIEDDAEMEFEDAQIFLKDAQAESPDIGVGDFIQEPMENAEFGRIAAQTAKQVIVQRVREAERAQVVEAYEDRAGELINGIVKRIERGNVYLDLGGTAEAFISQRNMIQGETVRPGDRLRAFLFEVKPEPRGPQLFASRTIVEFLVALFELEVPEIGQDLLSIMGGARDAGRRAKIAVRSNDKRTDPIGACVGMRGSRVQAVSNELAGERIDIILWDDNPAQFVINAMAPAEVAAIVVDEENSSMDIAVDESNLSQAIGRGGQNVRLASELTGWELNVLTVEQAEQKGEEESRKILERFMERLDVGEDVANILVQEGFSNIEEVAYVPESELLEVEEFDEEIVTEIRRRARDALLTQLIAKEEVLDENKPAEDLMQLEGMTERLAYRLAEMKVRTQEDLAELSVDELIDINEMSEEAAAELIMAARAPWFAEEED
jgi:N utilization substance protein A